MKKCKHTYFSTRSFLNRDGDRQVHCCATNVWCSGFPTAVRLSDVDPLSSESSSIFKVCLSQRWWCRLPVECVGAGKGAELAGLRVAEAEGHGGWEEVGSINRCSQVSAPVSSHQHSSQSAAGLHCTTLSLLRCNKHSPNLSACHLTLIGSPAY